MTEIECALALKLVPTIGDITAKTLLLACGNPKAVFNSSFHELLAIPGVQAKQAEAIVSFNNFRAVQQELNHIQSNELEVYCFGNSNYPVRLKSFPDAPFLFFGKGNMNLNPNRIVGIVGTRKNSEYGKDFTLALVEALKTTSCTVLSGLAIGIDSIAHKAALANQLPTIGVLGSGFNHFYPTRNKGLAAEMTQNGGVISDYFCEVQPYPENFPKRNRIVAALCDALVVVETSVKGGAKITAEIANSYNKDVFALPGRPTEYHSLGCNYLIRQNKAILINHPEDLITDLGWSAPHQHALKQHEFDFNLIEKHAHVIEVLMQKKRVGFDAILNELLSEDAGSLSMKLLELEFSGVIRLLPGNLYEMR